MLYKQIEQPNLIVLDLWEFARYGVGYEVGTPRFGGEREGFLEPCHAGRLEGVRVVVRKRGVRGGVREVGRWV